MLIDIPNLADNISVNQRAEPRRIIAASVEAMWTDRAGESRVTRGMFEDISASGASIRIAAPIAIGSRVEILWNNVRFLGTVMHAHLDGRDHVLGFKKDPGQEQWPGTNRGYAK